MIEQITQNLKGLEFDEIKIEENLNLTRGACLTEKVMVQLVNRGIGRQEAHEILRLASIKSREKKVNMSDILIEVDQIIEKFSKEELKEMFDPHKYLGKAIEQVNNLVKTLKVKYDI
jgi:adenylosuccinate lyase